MRILLEVWAKARGIKPMKAKNWARRKRLKTAEIQEVKTRRWTIEDDEKPPIR